MRGVAGHGAPLLRGLTAGLSKVSAERGKPEEKEALQAPAMFKRVPEAERVKNRTPLFKNGEVRKSCNCS